MSFLYGLLALGLAAFVQAAPTPENVLLARKYAPQFRFHKDEVYWPSTVDYFLPLVKLVDGSGKAVPQPDKLNGQNVDDAPNQGDGLFLNADINAGKGSFLRGQNPTSSQPTTYTFIVPKANGVVDLYYWLFFPFNEAKKIPLLGQVGDHVGDWERLTVRTVNGVATQVDYHAHSDTGAGTLPWDQIPKFDNNARPVGYIAKGSHGLWSSAGTFTYVNAVVFKLQDVTSDGGVAWDTKDSISPLDYIKTGYTGALEWLNFRGKWGNKGVDTCWWKIFYSGCEIVDGPGGPVRDDVLGSAKVGSKVAGLKVANAGVEKVLDKSVMQGHLSQTLATVADDDVSTYKFYLDSAPIASSFIGLEQRCSFFNETSEETSYTTSYATTPTVNSALDYTISTSACAEGFTIESYTLGLCSSSTTDATIAEECTWSTDRRVLRAFRTGIAGIQAASAVVVEDLDNWEF